MDNMSKSDLLNCQHSLTELILTGYAQKVMSKALKKYLLKTGSEKMIYIMTRAVDTRYSFLLGFIMSKNPKRFVIFYIKRKFSTHPHPKGKQEYLRL